MKRVLLFAFAILISIHCMGQGKSSFPFKGGKAAMIQFFKDSVVLSPDIRQTKATGVVMFKFTANDKGTISKVVVYYADDAVMAGVVSEVLQRSNTKWIIPAGEKTHDFVLPISFIFNAPPAETDELKGAVYQNYVNRKPLVTNNQVPLDMTTLLPAVVINYDIL